MADTLPHFICGTCGAWNGTVKPLAQCRVCEAPAPPPQAFEGLRRAELLRVLRELSRDNVALTEQVTRLQELGTKLTEELRVTRGALALNEIGRIERES